MRINSQLKYSILAQRTIFPNPISLYRERKSHVQQLPLFSIQYPSPPSFPLRHTHVMSRSPCHSPSAVVASTSTHSPTPPMQGCSLIHLSSLSQAQEAGEKKWAHCPQQHHGASPLRKYAPALRILATGADKCCCIALRTCVGVERVKVAYGLFSGHSMFMQHS
jgi:hypothetical protein